MLFSFCFIIFIYYKFYVQPIKKRVIKKKSNFLYEKEVPNDVEEKNEKTKHKIQNTQDK